MSYRAELRPTKERQRTLRRYGLTEETYAELLVLQEGVCAICRSAGSGRRSDNFVVDHDHVTGKVRGLLCHPCNRRRSNRDEWTPEPRRTTTAAADAEPVALRVGWYVRGNDSETGLPVKVSQPWAGDERYFDGDDWHTAPEGGWPTTTTKPSDLDG